jgi:hypothetical protein
LFIPRPLTIFGLSSPFAALGAEPTAPVNGSRAMLKALLAFFGTVNAALIIGSLLFTNSADQMRRSEPLSSRSLWVPGKKLNWRK